MNPSYLQLYFKFNFYFLIDRAIGKITTYANSELDALTNDLENLGSAEDFVKKTKRSKVKKESRKRKRDDEYCEEENAPKRKPKINPFVLEEASGNYFYY